MAAYAALNSVMQIIHDIQHHHSPPISIDFQRLQSLSQILTSLQEFLEAYKSPVADADEADPLEMRIADAAYAAEDVIESRIVDKIHLTRTHYRQTNPFFKCFRALRKPENVDDEQTKSIKFYQDLQRVIEEMDLIKQEAMQIDTEKEVAVSSSVAPFRSFSSSSAVVCSDVVLLGIMEKLTGGRQDCQVIPIVGMGGIGKTTLAKYVYERQLIKEHFDVCAWATISQQYNTREVICEVLSQATNKKKEDLSERSEHKLGLELYQYLCGRRFLIVMDDMWSIDAWENMQHFFPNNGNGSRILVTTRLSQLGSQLNNNDSVVQMEFLDEVSSWDLFCRTVFGERNSCPHELEKIGKKIVDNCRGLPLSIVVVGGILKRMERTPRCWEPIRNNLNSIVNVEDDKHCFRLLRLSYNHLPVYLKPCFLYMGVFEEDDRIRVTTLINLWVSEGFLKPMSDISMELTIAMDFLKDLIDRNLILIDGLGSTGNIKTCRIHDLLRDFCLNEGQRERFHHVIGRCSPQGKNMQCRRVVIPRNTSKKKVLKDLKSIPRVRSIICEYERVPRCRNFGLLRTLHAFKYNHGYVSSLPTQYVNLRHLAIAGPPTSLFFSSFNLFWNLHTLIVVCRNDNKFNFSTEIWKMPQFRHIEFIGDHWCLPDPPSDKYGDVVIMENMHILKGVKNLKCCEEVVKRIPNIKKLKIYYEGQLKGTNHDDPYRVSNIKYLCKLESLSVKCMDFKYYRGAPYLHKLSFPHSLKSLTLRSLEWEAALEKIGSLPHLEKLKLWDGWFKTGEWEIVEDQFPELRLLKLYWCGLKQWTVEEGSSVLPRLEQLHLEFVRELEEIPCEIGHIPTLQKVKLMWCSESVVKSAKEMVEEQVELQGEQLPFHVTVTLWDKNQALLGLADHNFTVH